MKELYFTRHGQTTWNVGDKICGSTDVPLTDEGYRQAEALGRLLREDARGIDRILCSPLIRAFETARIISEATGIPFAADRRITEQCFGVWEGTSPRNSEAFAEAKTHFLDSYGGGESMMRVGQRVYNLLDELRESEGTVLLVAHNGIVRFVRSYFTDLTNEEFGRSGMKNCELLRFVFEP